MLNTKRPSFIITNLLFIFIIFSEILQVCSTNIHIVWKSEAK